MPNSENFKKVQLRFFAFCLFVSALWFSPNELASNSDLILAAPSFQHIFGCDNLGRDLFFRILSGAKISVTIGLLGALFSLALALLGLALCNLNSKLRSVLVLVAEWISSFPTFMLGLIFLALLIGTTNRNLALVLFSISWAFALSHWMGSFRIILQASDSVRVQSYFQSSIALGASRWHLLIKHIWPYVVDVLGIQFLILVSQAILFESALGLLGFGVASPQASWGSLLQEGWKSLSVHPHLIWAPSLVLVSFLISVRSIFRVKSLDSL